MERQNRARPALRRKLVRILPLVTVATLACAHPARAATPASSLYERVRPGIDIPSPRVRISLGAAEDRVRIDAAGGGYRLLDGSTGTDVWPARRPGSTLVVAVGEPAPGGASVFRVQVGSFRSQSAAEELASRLARSYRQPADAVWQAHRGVWRVRVGREASSVALGDLLRRLRGDRFSDAWVTEEPVPRLRNARLRLLDDGWSSHDAPSQSLIFVPSSGARLTVNGRTYRGLVEVILSDVGALTVVNELNVEDYLRGVVPEELGPSAFPEIEALKAQAVAARTYVAGNLGQFAESGYDICDTARCQVYGGAASEHPLSDRAVRETRNQVLLYDGRPVNAMYTSTCGGHTEDVEVVFPEMTGPYLRAVPCIAEREELERRRMQVTGRPVQPPLGEGRIPGATGALEILRLVAHGLAPRESLDARWRHAPVERAELQRLGSLLAERAGAPAPGELEGELTKNSLWRWWSGLFSGSLGTNGVVPTEAVGVVLSGDDAALVPAEDRATVASLVSLGIVAPDPDGLLAPGEVPLRGEILGWLARTVELFGAAPLRRGSVRKVRRGRITIRHGRTERDFKLRPAPDLLQQVGGTWFRVSAAELYPGDVVEFVAGVEDDRDSLALLAVPERKGLSDDRTSSRFRWEVAKDRRELEKTLDDVAPVGRLRNLSIRRRGASGRVAELEVTGTAGVAVVEGFRLRRALGLPETLFEMSLQHEADGLLRRVVFRGRGWGHGVGLCQVGAYGMAQRGESHRDILRHYYTGVKFGRYAGH